ncbi:progranulin [Salpingoeca rosetta]|uniref:Progranulin n=1 Tax=Salpingoeca rosetta (strain ATCC 50818 / BSB-021) TaxID=946362 RepID=F2UB64_SALR5|nr:progranulin [Salpingoeca rosetta]EGD74077.1 progranulin [Salpingoeca rosetta]|eukprot:XP_004993639.1 progranulin [Salpingoeca rosetta]
MTMTMMMQQRGVHLVVAVAVAMLAVALSQVNAAERCSEGAKCPSHNTCCKMDGGRFGCCPYANATCCSNFCCPPNSQCAEDGRSCDTGPGPTPVSPTSSTTTSEPATKNDLLHNNRQHELVPVTPASQRSAPSHNAKDSLESSPRERRQDDFGVDQPNAIVCPDGSYCPDFNTCCQIPGGYGCCSLSDGVCCPDGAFCCPSGMTCGQRSCYAEE